MPYQITAEKLEEVWDMPALDHHPLRPKRFAFENSQVVKFIQQTLNLTFHDAVKAFERLRRNRDILFDPTQKRWVGKHLMEPAAEEGSQPC